MDGRTDVHRRVAAVDHPHQLRENVVARHKMRAQRQAVGHDDVEQKRHRHAGEERHAQPPKILPRGLVQQVEQRERNPREPQKIRYNGIFAERNHIVQPAVDPQVRRQDGVFQQREKR